jgi:hypothetical protein
MSWKATPEVLGSLGEELAGQRVLLTMGCGRDLQYVSPVILQHGNRATERG